MSHDIATAKARWRHKAGLAVGTVVIGAFLVPMFAGSAHAAPRLSTATTCDTSQNCEPSTTSTTTQQTVTITVTASYSNQDLNWQACGLPKSYTGSKAQLFVDGAAESGAGSTGTVNANGCTPDPHFATCLAAGSHTVSVTDGASSGSTDLNVSSANACSGAGGSSGSRLAFTGADIMLTLAAAALLIVLGYALVRLNRQRRRAN
jgi:hypothetical protein